MGYIRDKASKVDDAVHGAVDTVTDGVSQLADNLSGVAGGAAANVAHGIGAAQGIAGLTGNKMSSITSKLSGSVGGAALLSGIGGPLAATAVTSGAIGVIPQLVAKAVGIGDGGGGGGSNSSSATNTPTPPPTPADPKVDDAGTTQQKAVTTGGKTSTMLSGLGGFEEDDAKLSKILLGR